MPEDLYLERETARDESSQRRLNQRMLDDLASSLNGSVAYDTSLLTYEWATSRQLHPGYYGTTFDPTQAELVESNAFEAAPDTSDVIHEEMANPFVSPHQATFLTNAITARTFGSGRVNGQNMHPAIGVHQHEDEGGAAYGPWT